MERARPMDDGAAPPAQREAARPGPVIIPYFAAGAGHLSAARAVAAALGERGCAAEPVDAASLGGPRTERFYVSSWDWLLRHRRAGQLAFAGDSALPALSRLINRGAAAAAVPRARELLDIRRPAMVLATHWGTAHIFARARRRARHRPPLWYLFTELGGAHRLLACGADRCFAMAAAAAAALRASGVAPDRIEQVAPVAHRRFLAAPDRGEARHRLRLDRRRPVVFYGLGGAGIGDAEGFVRACTRAVPDAVVLVSTGRNAALRRRLASRFAGRRVIPLPFRDDMEVLLAAADLAAGKCGTLFTLEVTAARLPFLITQVGAPNERHSRSFIVRNGYGWYAPSPRAFAAALRRALVGGELQSARRALARAPRPTGAGQVAGAVIAAMAGNR